MKRHMSKSLPVGILALQGDFAEHQAILRALGAESVLVKLPRDLERVERLIIPGGESTTIGKLLTKYKLLAPIRARIKAGMPVWGTCAGAIVMSKNIVGALPRQQSLAVMNITARRNAFGRQLDSFETTIAIKGIKQKVPVLFIRAPIFEKPAKGTEVLATHNSSIVAAREKKMLITSFHPELTGATALHEYFLAM